MQEGAAGNHGKKVYNSLWKKVSWEKRQQPLGRQTKPPRPADVDEAHASAKALVDMQPHDHQTEVRA